MLSWQNFWATDPKLFRIVMKKSTDYFAEHLIAGKLLRTEDKVLDFGCGPGYLAERLVHQLSSYWGVDISPAYINSCTKQFNEEKNSRFTLLPETDKTFGLLEAGLPEKYFDVIIILSVVQYFTDRHKVYELLKSCKPLLGEKGKILLADVIESNDTLIKDVMNVLLNSIRKKYFTAFLRFIYQAKFSSYNEIRKKNHLLCLTEKEISEICTSLGLQYQILPGYTLHTSRVTYCITA